MYGGASGGKPTLARRYVEEHPLTLNLDVDVARAVLGGWLDQPTEAGLLARRMALEMARVHLRARREVVVPQFLGRLEFVLALQQLCDEVGAEFVEVVLLSNPQDAARRFARRCGQPETAEHRDAGVLLECSGGMDASPEMYGRLLEVVASRPGTRTVVTVDERVEQAYNDLLGQVGTRPRT